MLRVCCTDKEQCDDAKEIGKLVVKMEKLLPTERQGLKGVIYGVHAGQSEKESLDSVRGPVCKPFNGEVVDCSQTNTTSLTPTLENYGDLPVNDRIEQCLVN